MVFGLNNTISEDIPLRPLLQLQHSEDHDSSDSNQVEMKFSSSLKFNAVSDWWEEYIAYDALKKTIYQLEKQQHGLDYDLESNERVSLLQDTDESRTDAVFIPLLDKELFKITSFYQLQEKELLTDIATLEEEVREREEAGLTGGTYYFDDDGEEDDEEEEDDVDDDVSAQSPERTRTRSHKRKSMSRGKTRHRSAASGSLSAAEQSPVGHRYSISSSEEGLEHETTPVSPVGPRSSKEGTMDRARQFAKRVSLRGVRESFTSSGAETSIWSAKTNYAWDTRLLFKRRITNLYVSLTGLKSYVDMNYSGFRKILKKYDKVTDSHLKDRYMHDVVEQALPFTPSSRDKVNEGANRLLSLYAKCVTRGDMDQAKQQLKLHQREKIAWERDTVWRQMIGKERRGETDGVPKTIGATVSSGDEDEIIQVPTPAGRFKITRRKVFKVLAVTVLAILLNVQTVKREEANRCLAILVFSTILWATEAVPLFVTSMAVPMLLVWFRVIRSEDGTRLSAADATKYVFSIMFSPTIMLLIGGFTISSALSKTNIDRILITKVLSLAGTRPRTVLLAFMGVSCFASMWISNVAAPTLCFTLIQPILRTLPPKSSFGRCLILAIALAANIGGQSSPISSPQNLIAIGAMDPPIGWSTWFIVALPVSAISILLIWLFLLWSYQPSRMPDGDGMLEIRPVKPIKESFTVKQYWVSFVCLMTIGLWCFENMIKDLVGDMGVIAILPLVCFFSTNVLKKNDFEQFAWTIVFLAMGGIALGKGVMSSGLLEIMDVGIRDLVEGRSLFTVVLILSPVVLVISTFISHTIASVLLVPIAKEVGSNMKDFGPGNHANLLIFITALICSTGMGMPVSGFPNQTAANQEDELGHLYLTNVDFLKNGIPASVIATAVVSTVGFLLMKAVGL